MDASLSLLGITNCLVICFPFYFLLILIYGALFCSLWENEATRMWDMTVTWDQSWSLIHNIPLHVFVGSTKNRCGTEKITRTNRRKNAEIMNNSDPEIDSTSEWSPSEGSFKEDNEKSLKNHQMTQVIPHFLNVVIILHLTLQILRQPQSDWALGTFHNPNFMEVIISKSHLISRKHSSKTREKTLI